MACQDTMIAIDTVILENEGCLITNRELQLELEKQYFVALSHVHSNYLEMGVTEENNCFKQTNTSIKR